MKEYFRTRHRAPDHLGALESPEARRAPAGLSGLDTQIGRSHMGYIPSLDGLRAVAVIAVILYHANFGWIRGGFIGVEIFFVVSGFLITSLLLEEFKDTGTVSMSQFWKRRARRLLPALFTMLVTISAWALLFSEYKIAQLRHDIIAAFFYVSNWWQIFFTEVPYFGPKDPPLLRHLWSLAIEEQWYLLWPIAFVALMRRRLNRAQAAQRLLIIAAVIIVFTAIFYSGSNPDRINFLYLSTLTRSTGLLIGAAGAFLWCPWRVNAIARKGIPTAADLSERALNIGAATGATVLTFAALGLTVEGAFLYRGGLVLVSFASLLVVACAVHPNAKTVQRILGATPLVEIGKRSYGLYLWHWPIFLFAGARSSTGKFFLASAVTAVVAECSYQLIESPIRGGALARAFQRLRDYESPLRQETLVIAIAYATAVVVLTASVGIALSATRPIDISLDPNQELEFGSSTIIANTTMTDPVNSNSTQPGVVAPVVTLAISANPVRLLIVGDSQAKALAINLPSGIEKFFTVTDGSVSGCGVYDSGTGMSPSINFKQDFEFCRGWNEKWAKSVVETKAQIALVIVGAWEVLDVLGGGVNYVVGTPQADTLFKTQIKRGVDALVAAGAKVALLEVPCMRPKEVNGAGIPPLPERGDDARTQHLNELLMQVSDENPVTTTFVKGPREWCTSSIIANDLGYRWDGVHVYKPGAKLIMETITPSLLAIAVK